jgi:nitrite reductase/ring-hydroxylating ferredoxin subunit
MTFKPALELTVLQQNSRHTTTIDGHKILLLWHDGAVYAVQSQCPHLKLPLAKGKLTEHNTIVCPFHKSEFDLKTGETQCWSPWPPLLGSALGKLSKEKNLKIYPTKIDNGTILVDIN